MSDNSLAVLTEKKKASVGLLISNNQINQRKHSLSHTDNKSVSLLVAIATLVRLQTAREAILLPRRLISLWR
ncbi:hypothetical protein [Glaesserella sp. 15-184]|uniref:Uncharacterized protein n=1 Tax=Glaesserella australis TaxID=2094024 RepID=A0A328BYM2_9PAST|nr:hypothetical protein [Glaesserella sp. 15-184]RAL18735.1 hypothetical protein C5N92_06260 [Glaesserella australis]